MSTFNRPGWRGRGGGLWNRGFSTTGLSSARNYGAHGFQSGPRDENVLQQGMRWLNQGKRLNLVEVQQEVETLISLCSQEKYAVTTEMLFKTILQIVDLNYEEYRRLLMGLIRNARRMVASSDLLTFFHVVLRDGVFPRETHVASVLEGIGAYAEKCAEEKEELRSTCTAVVHLVGEIRAAAPALTHNGKDFLVKTPATYAGVDVTQNLPGPLLLSEDLDLDTSKDHFLNLPVVAIGTGITDDMCEAHLRVQYLLMRADCLHGATRSICCIREALTECGPLPRSAETGHFERNLFQKVRRLEGPNHQTRLYFRVFCNGVGMDTHAGPCFVFKLSNTARIRSHSLMVGNLVMWSGQYFSRKGAIYIGVVCSVKDFSVERNRGFAVQVKAVLNGPSFGELWYSGRCAHFTFLETSRIFFKPYHSAMRNLMNKTHVPLQSSILRGDTATPPQYIVGASLLRVESLVLKKEHPGNTLLDVADPVSWDQCEDWSIDAEQDIAHNPSRHVLDETQRAAMQHLFTHRVAIVQGTPGTGKTFVGVKFLQLLLENKEQLNVGPILCMAKTNHAVSAILHDIHRLVPGTFSMHLGRGAEDLPSKRCYGKPSRKMFKLADEIREMSQMPGVYNSMVASLGDRFSRFIRNISVELSEGYLALCHIHCSSSEEHGTLHELLHALWKHNFSVLKDVFPPADWLTLCQEEILNAPNPHAQALLTELQSLLCRERVDSTAVWYYYFSNTVSLTITSEVVFQWWLHPPENNQPMRLGGLELHPDFPSVVGSCLLPRNGPAEVISDANFRRLSGLLAGISEESAGDLSEETEQSVFLDEEGVREKERRENVLEGSGEAAILGAVPVSDAINESIQPFIECLTGATVDFAQVPVDCRALLTRSVVFVTQKRQLRSLLDLMESEDTQQTLLTSKREVTEQMAESLKSASIIAGTSDAVMSHLDVLQLVKPRVMVVEEAAEVLESHVLASLTENLEHLVLIGDHKQLSPMVNEMAIEHKGLGVSLQERMILCGAPFVTLTMQRRMHPDISRFVHKYYARNEMPGDQPVEITDHPSTHRLPAPKGVQDDRRAFLVTYTASNECCERMHPVLESPCNEYEVSVVSAMVSHLVKYNPDRSIVVLVPYTGQLLEMRRKLEAFLGTVLCRTVDDYQGEEADIVLLSLVRTEKPGFLRRENRACVALSRARMGCYVVGCRDVMDVACPIFQEYASLMDAGASTAVSFPASCPRHRHLFHFATLPEYDRAHCTEICKQPLPCGHCCSRSCHGTEDHAGFACMAACERVGEECNPPRHCQHACPKHCFEECGDCAVQVAFTCSDCGGVTSISCHVATSGNFLCRKLVPVGADTSLCGHAFHAPCYMLTAFRSQASGRSEANLLHNFCQGKCEHHLPCGHLCPKMCHVMRDEDHEKAAAECIQRVSCEHPKCHHMSSRKCNSDPQKQDSFPKCREKCGKKAHTFCDHPCELQCGHTDHCECNGKSTKACPKCSVGFSVLCKEYENAVCPTPCRAKLACGHKCPGSCGLCGGAEGLLLPFWRNHQPCSGRCLSALPCGHVCKDGCSVSCGPCTEVCTFSCGHSSGCGSLGRKHLCNKCPARNCQMRCAWQCEHHACTRRCCEPCDRPKCDERCSKRLPCDHQCFGLCGEVCPTFCPACYASGNAGMPERFLEPSYTLISDGDERDQYLRGELKSAEGSTPVEYRLVQMRCCGALTLSGFLDRHIEASVELLSSGGDVLVGLPKCLHCQSPIWPDMYRRQGKILKVCVRRIQAHAQKLSSQRETEGMLVRRALTAVLDCLGRYTYGNQYSSTTSVSHKMQDVLDHLAQKPVKAPKHQKQEWKEAHANLWKQLTNDVSSLHEQLSPPLQKVLRWATDIKPKTPATVAPLAGATLRYVAFLTYGIERQSAIKSRVTDLMEDLFDADPRDHNLLHSLSQEIDWAFCREFLHGADTELVEKHRGLFNPDNDTDWESLFKKRQAALEELLPLAEERTKQTTSDLLQALTSALGVTAGHWYECRNGHLYVVGDCGGATEYSQCPECHERIGGQQHAIDATNRSAAERVRRGAQPAWPQPQLH